MEEGPPPLLIIISIRQSTSFLYLSSGQCPHPSRVGPKPCRSAGKGFFLSSSNALCCCHCRCRCMPPHHGMLASQMQRGRAKPNEGERGTARRVCELGPVECRGKKRRSAILESLLFLQVAKEEEEERRLVVSPTHLKPDEETGRTASRRIQLTDQAAWSKLIDAQPRLRSEEVPERNNSGECQGCWV